MFESGLPGEVKLRWRSLATQLKECLLLPGIVSDCNLVDKFHAVRQDVGRFPLCSEVMACSGGLGLKSKIVCLCDSEEGE